MYGMFFDYWYIVLVVPAMILAAWAQYKVKSTYSKYSKVLNARGITGAYAAQAVLTHYGITDVRIEMTSGNARYNKYCIASEKLCAFIACKRC